MALAANAESPSIFLVAAATPRKKAWWTSPGGLRPMCVIVWLIQTLVLIWVGVVAKGHTNFLLPGFREPLAAGHMRQRWLTHFCLDCVAFVLLVYVCWSNWCRLGTLRVYRFYWHEGGDQLNRAILGLAMIAKTTAIVGVVFVTYLLFRLENKVGSMLFNVLAVEFITSLDGDATSVASGDAAMWSLVKEAQVKLEAISEELVEDKVLCELYYLESAQLGVVLRLALYQRSAGAILELCWRLLLFFYQAVSFSFLVLTLTGGHIAHSHVRNVLWFLCLLPNKSRARETQKKFNFLRVGGMPDQDYAFVAMAMIFFVWVACFCFYMLAQRLLPDDDDDDDEEQSDNSPVDASPEREIAKREAGLKRATTLKILMAAEDRVNSPKQAPPAASQPDNDIEQQQEEEEQLEELVQ